MNFNWPIIGHKNIQKFLQTSIVKNKLSHAYLFSGPSYLGKETMAHYFIASILCQKKTEIIPCFKCFSCQAIEKRNHPDLLFIEPEKTHIGIDQARHLKDCLNFMPLLGSKKIAIIKMAEKLTREATSSLLKILEEPPAYSLIVMLANTLVGILPTILSRVQIINFKPVPSKEIAENLKKEETAPKNLSEIISFSFNRPGLAKTFLDPSLFQERKKIAHKFLKAISSPEARFSLILESLSLPPFFIWQTILRDLLRIKFKMELVNSSLEKEISAISGRYSKKDLYRIILNIEKAKSLWQMNVNKRLILENLFLNV